jgi:hypothetical protein
LSQFLIEFGEERLKWTPFFGPRGRVS